jgi:release factor glutamine methyltransferase
MNMPPSPDSKDIAWLIREKYPAGKTRQLTRDMARLAAGEPLAYVIGHVPFLDVHIDLSSRPLIPRPETEYWVSHAIDEIKKISGNKPFTALDLFSGSGAIGIAIAKAFPKAHIDFGEKYQKHARQIRKNIAYNGISHAHVYTSDMFAKIPKKKYAYIFANPPYVSLAKKYRVQKSVIKWEPKDAVFAKEDGMYWIKKLIMHAPQYIAHDGILCIEHDPHQRKAIRTIARKAGFQEVTFLKDQYGRWRIAVLVRATNTA